MQLPFLGILRPAFVFQTGKRSHSIRIDCPVYPRRFPTELFKDVIKKGYYFQIRKRQRSSLILMGGFHEINVFICFSFALSGQGNGGKKHW